MAEVPGLPGCRAWGNTQAEALANLQSVAWEFVLSYKKHGDALPKAVEGFACRPEVKSPVTNGISICI